MEQEEYLTAYANGMQFVLLALEGRLQGMERMDTGSLSALFLEYHEMALRLRDRAKGAPPVVP